MLTPSPYARSDHANDADMIPNAAALRKRACPVPADMVQSSPMDTDIQDRVAQINAFYAARRAERAAAAQIETDAPPPPQADVVRHVCARCGWTWQTFAGVVPKACPGCRARKWQTPAPPRVSDTMRTCLHCGHEWRARKSHRPCACPVCASRNWDKPPKFRRNAENAENAPV